MGDLISRDRLLRDIYFQEGRYPETHFMRMAIREQPAVGAVEVVRCKDCIHWYEPEGVCLKIYSDGNVSPYAWQDRKPDDFCSCGKKKI